VTDIFVEILLGFIDIDERRPAFVRLHRSALDNCLRYEGYEKATKDRTAVLLEEILCGIDKDYLTRIEGVKDVHLIPRV